MSPRNAYRFAPSAFACAMHAVIASRLLWMSANRASFIVSASRGRATHRALLGRGLQAVPDAAHGGDLHARRLELPAEPVHVDLDRVAADLLTPSAQMPDQVVLVHRA